MPTTKRQHVTKVEFTHDEILALIKARAAEVMGHTIAEDMDVAVIALDPGNGPPTFTAVAVLVENV